MIRRFTQAFKANAVEKALS